MSIVELFVMDGWRVCEDEKSTVCVQELEREKVSVRLGDSDSESVSVSVRRAAVADHVTLPFAVTVTLAVLVPVSMVGDVLTLAEGLLADIFTEFVCDRQTDSVLSDSESVPGVKLTVLDTVLVREALAVPVGVSACVIDGVDVFVGCLNWVRVSPGKTEMLRLLTVHEMDRLTKLVTLVVPILLEPDTVLVRNSDVSVSVEDRLPVRSWVTEWEGDLVAVGVAEGV
jgi:hypothetical protein